MFTVLYRENGETCGVCGEDGVAVVWAGNISAAEAEKFVAGLNAEGVALEALSEQVLAFLLRKSEPS